MTQTVSELFSFLKASPTAFHAVSALESGLSSFEKLHENEKWNLVPGKKYYVTRNNSSIIAFTLPENGFSSFNIVSSHTDSPTFKLKENACICQRGKYLQLDVERYGGMLMATWLDRPLSVAGRVVLKTENGVESRLVNFDRDMVLIPNVAIHMNRNANDGYKWNPAVDLLPLYGLSKETGSFKENLARELGVSVEDILGTDLYLYNRQEGTVWGKDNELISCGRLDDLECAFSSLKAFTAANPSNHCNVMAVFDNEEVGSGTKQGADSTFLYDVLKRICLSLGKDEQEYLAALSASFMLSADNAHAMHPNHPEFSDPANCSFMNEGIVVKFNANQKYTTDAVSEAVFHAICQKAGVPVQHYANRSDMPGGSTLGNISGSHVSINTLDIGLAQLAMHSAFETAGAKDLDYMISGMKAFYETDITATADGSYTF